MKVSWRANLLKHTANKQTNRQTNRLWLSSGDQTYKSLKNQAKQAEAQAEAEAEGGEFKNRCRSKA